MYPDDGGHAPGDGPQISIGLRKMKDGRHTILSTEGIFTGISHHKRLKISVFIYFNKVETIFDILNPGQQRLFKHEMSLPSVSK